jgi:hypothetical protein
VLELVLEARLTEEFMQRFDIGIVGLGVMGHPHG